MSFILDALKKSEAERQRQSGPTLLELRITQPRRRYPAWALWVALLLIFNVTVLLYVVLRRVEAPTLPVVSSTSAPPPMSVAAVPSPSLASGAPRAPPPAAPAPAAASVVHAPTSVVAVPPLATAPGAAVPEATASPTDNPADDEPAVPARSAPALAAPAPSAADYSSLPNLASLNGSVPSLQLNLLVSSKVASERYALINMHRVREGDVLPEGPRILAITRDGVAMDYDGQQFMLRPSGNASP